jgi:hypothetical protein
MSTLEVIDFLEKPDVCYGMSDDTLRRSDLGMLRRIAGCDYGHRGNREDAPNSVLRLQVAGLVSHDGRVWTVTALGRETVCMNVSCRDGSEGLRRPDAYYRGRREDADAGYQGDTADIVGTIVLHELNLANKARSISAVRAAEPAAPVVAGRMEVIAGGLLASVGWLVDRTVALVLAGIAWASAQATGTGD